MTIAPKARALCSGSFLALAVALSAAGAQAQSAPPASSASAAASSTGASNPGAVQEIVVTATRRAVNLQQVTATVEAVPAATLQAYNITSALQLPDLTPGLVMSPSGGNNAYLRGVGTPSTGYNDAQVAVYLDGIYLANPSMSIYSFNNIDQIEVLKGPQGTLYGRNATAGLIGITTRDPGATPRVDASVGYANYDTFTQNFYGSTPLTDTLAANLAIYHSKQNQGWSRNVFNNTEEQKSDETGVESKLVWKPTSSTKVTASFIYDYNNRDIGYAYEPFPGTVANDGTLYTGRYRASSRVDPSAPFTAYIGSLKIQQDLGFANLMSLSAYQTSHQDVLFSPAAGPGQPVAGEAAPVDNFFQRNRTWSQEFQLTSKPSPGSKLDWVAGAFFYSDGTELDLQSWTTCVGNVCAPGAGTTPTNNVGYPTTLSYSGYADGTYHILDATRLTVGVRYTDETKGLTGLVTPLPGFPNSVATLPASTVTYPGEAVLPNGTVPPIVIPTKLHFDKLTYRVVLAQDFGPNIHAYVSDNLGFKAGAYNGNLFTNPPALPETLQAYEAGVKSELFDRRLRLNAAYFYYDYQNVQVRSTAPPAPPGNALLENAAKERQRGVDVDFNFVVGHGFTINGGAEYLDSKYASFPGTTCSTPSTKVVNGVVVGTAIVVGCNLAGYTTPFSPPVSGFVGFVYKVDTEMGGWTLSANDAFNSRYPIVADNSLHQNPHHIVDASLLWTSPKRTLDAQLFVRNLTGEYTYVVGFANSAGSYYMTPGAPRTFGVTLGYHFF